MLGTTNLEVELVGAILGDVGSVTKVDDTSGVSLVLSTLGEEGETLAGLAGPGSNGVGDGRLLVLVEDVEVLALDGLLLEVEETLGEAKAPLD